MANHFHLTILTSGTLSTRFENACFFKRNIDEESNIDEKSNNAAQ